MRKYVVYVDIRAVHVVVDQIYEEIYDLTIYDFFSIAKTAKLKSR